MSADSMPTVLILVNKDTTILHFRLPLLRALREAGYRVVVALPPGERVTEIAEAGAELLFTPMKKDRLTLIGDRRLWRRYREIIRDLSPSIILTYTIKPALFGGMAAGRVPLIATITGRGRALTAAFPLRAACLLWYRYALRYAAVVCFQNEADHHYFTRHRIAPGHHLTFPGSGVELDRFAYLPYPSSREGVAFAFVSRLLPEKGIHLYVKLARRIRRTHPDTVFHVAGFGDAQTEAHMRALDREGVIVYHGKLRDIRPLLSEVHALIHPTYYPEGLANVLMEASSMGRPVITTDRAGCREAVEDGVTGYLVPERRLEPLVTAVERFLSLPNRERARMGDAARRKMEQSFDRRMVVARYLSLVRHHARPAATDVSSGDASPDGGSSGDLPPSPEHPTNTVT